jgi:dTDP-4-dehydrorhamnose reductase
MKKIYIAGSGGMLGEAFYKNFTTDYKLKCTDIDVNESWLSYLDFRDRDNYLNDVKEFSPDYLFHLGAHTSLEYCELNKTDAYLTNTTSVENAVYISNNLGIPLLYISTAGIFDGTKSVFDDWDQPNPLGVYARTKYLGERYVIENCNRYLICRAGWMMGGGPKKDKKFIHKIMKQIKNGANELYVVNDKDGTPTYTHDFALTVKHLIKNEYWGLYNCVCNGQTSRFEVTIELLKILGLSRKIKVNQVSSEYFESEYFAARPLSERLLNTKLELRQCNFMRDWKIALDDYVKTYYSNYL